MTKDEALKLAKDCLTDHQMGAHIITTIKEALAAPVQEPVAWLIDWPDEPDLGNYFSEEKSDTGRCRPLYTTPPATQPAPVQDEHQAFISSLSKDGDDRMFMQIDHWARESYKRHQSSVRGQMITAADAYESHVIWATLRWAKDNTSPAAPVQEPVGKVIASVPHLRSISVELLPEAPVPSEDSLIYTTPPAAQRQWVGLTDEEFVDFVTSDEYGTAGLIAAVVAKLKEKNT